MGTVGTCLLGDDVRGGISASMGTPGRLSGAESTPQSLTAGWVSVSAMTSSLQILSPRFKSTLGGRNEHNLADLIQFVDEGVVALGDIFEGHAMRDHCFGVYAPRSDMFQEVRYIPFHIALRGTDRDAFIHGNADG